MPSIPVLPKQRATLADMVQQSTAPTFLGPVLLLAVATAILGAAVGFIPLLAASLGAEPIIGMGAVSILAIISAVVQPRIGRIHDSAPQRANTLMLAGAVLLIAAVVLFATAPILPVILLGAAAIGLGVGLITPLGFARLAATTPPERMGRTMGSAELGREVGDAGGPILVGLVAGATTLPLGLGALAVACAVAAAGGASMMRSTASSADRSQTTE